MPFLTFRHFLFHFKSFLAALPFHLLSFFHKLVLISDTNLLIKRVNSLEFSMAMADISFLYFFFFFFFPVCSQSQNTSFIFHGFNGSDIATNISFDGASMITPDGALMLTNRTKQAIGHAFYSKPINTTSSFSTRFVFQIVSPDAGGGYGLAFVLAPSPQLQNTEAGHYLGIFNSSSDGEPSNRIFLVEFDTVNGFRQDEDNQGNHVGISLNSMDTNASKPASYAVNNTENNEDILMGSGAPIQAWIEYDAEVKVVNVTIAPLGMPKPLKHLIDLRVNLTQHLGEESYVGFSAATGEVSSYHYLLGWSFSSNGEAQELERSRLPSPPRRVEPPRSSSRIRHGVIVALISSLCVVTVLLLGLLVFVLVYRMCTDAEILEDWEIDCPRRFRYKDLHIATKGFKQSELIGTGGFGSVYRGVLPTTGNDVAVKRITRNSLQGVREFVAEIESLGRLRHKNLVNLQGWCKRKNDLLLVYDYIPNGSLDTLLFKPKTGFVLDWNYRFNIVKGIAEGLLYLHEEWEKIVIHRDVKPSNVLIDADMNGKLGDFGLARLFQHGELSHTTNVVGTVGYIAPELARNGTASASSDVYAYGILLLEVAAGRRPTDSGNFLLVDWVMEHQQLGRILDVVDPKLGHYNVEQMELVLEMGLICCHSKPEFRPTMRQVLRYLNGDEMLPSVDDLDSVDTKGKHEMKSRPSKSGSTNTLTAPYHSYASEGISHNSVYNGR